MDRNTLIIALLGFFILLVFILIITSVVSSKNARSSKRIKNMQIDSETKSQIKAHKLNEKARRKSRENTLKSVEEQRNKGKKSPNQTLAGRLTQANLDISTTSYYILSFVVAIVVFLITLFILRLNWAMAIGVAFSCGAGLPHFIVSFLIKRRIKKFLSIFPNAIDIIVRGIRSGLPLNDCIRIISNDTEEPLRGEFRKMSESMQMGMSVPDACERLYQSMPSPETNFFSIVIAIQSSAGGNLAEALGNLSNVLRERRKLGDKIKSCSQEAKASATIIGSLPFVVAGLVTLSSPGYLDPLFNTDTGHKVLIGCALAMGTGIFIMSRMINFKF